MLEANESAGIVCRPYLDAAKSVGVRADDVMEYSELEIRSLIVTSTDKSVWAGLCRRFSKPRPSWCRKSVPAGREEGGAYACND